MSTKCPKKRLENKENHDEITQWPSMPRNSTARKRIATVPSTTDLTTDKSKLASQIEIIRKLREHEHYNKIEYYDPYPYQKRFHDTGNDGNQRLLMAGNRIGKAFSGASETALHLTVLYPRVVAGQTLQEPNHSMVWRRIQRNRPRHPAIRIIRHPW